MDDLLLFNGRIHTQDPSRPLARSVSCANGTLSRFDEDLPARRRIDLKGRTVIPGLIDAHAHLLSYGRLLHGLDLSTATSWEDIVRRARERAVAGRWVVGRGWELAEFPTHQSLSEAVPDSPVWLKRKDGHSAVANARALALAQITRETPDPPGGTIGRDSNGEPTGMLFENALTLVDRLIPHESSQEHFLAAQREALRYGIVGLHDACVDDEYLKLLRELDAGRLLRLRIHAMYWHESADRMVDFLKSNCPTSGRLNVRSIKLFLDGSVGSRTAAMLEPFCGAPETRGMLRIPIEDLHRILSEAARTGHQVCTHAIGDRANRTLLDAYDAAKPAADLRWRIEHAQHVHPEDLRRFSRWIASYQPSHVVADRRLLDSHIGPHRHEGSYPWRSMPRRALGTDAPVDRLDPRWTFYCAVTRGGFRTGEVLTPEEALRGMTADAAFAGFQEGGVLSPGRPADMVVLSNDWLRVPPKEVLESRVLLTIMDGRIAYQEKGEW